MENDVECADLQGITNRLSSQLLIGIDHHPAPALIKDPDHDVVGIPVKLMPEEFWEFNKNNDGILSVDEIKTACSHMRDVEQRRLPLKVFQDERVLKQMAKLDTDYNGYLDDNLSI